MGSAELNMLWDRITTGPEQPQPVALPIAGLQQALKAANDQRMQVELEHRAIEFREALFWHYVERKKMSPKKAARRVAAEADELFKTLHEGGTE